MAQEIKKVLNNKVSRQLYSIKILIIYFILIQKKEEEEKEIGKSHYGLTCSCYDMMHFFL